MSPSNSDDFRGSDIAIMIVEHEHICAYCTLPYYCIMNIGDCIAQEEPFCCDICWLPRVGIDI